MSNPTGEARRTSIDGRAQRGRSPKFVAAFLQKRARELVAAAKSAGLSPASLAGEGLRLINCVAQGGLYGRGLRPVGISAEEVGRAFT